MRTFTQCHLPHHFWNWLTFSPGRPASALIGSPLFWALSSGVLSQQGSRWCWVSYAEPPGEQPVQAVEVATHTARGSFIDSTLTKYYVCMSGRENDPSQCCILINSYRCACQRRRQGTFSSFSSSSKDTAYCIFFFYILWFILWFFYFLIFIILLWTNLLMNDCAAELNYLSVHDPLIDYLVVLSFWGVSSCTLTHLTFDPPSVSTVIGGPISCHLSMRTMWAHGRPPRRLSLLLLAHIGVNPWQRDLAQFDLCFSNFFLFFFEK